MQNRVKSQHASTDAKTLSADLKLSILDHLHFLLTFEVPRGKMRGCFLLNLKHQITQNEA